MSQVRVLSPLLVLLRRLRGPTLLAFAAGAAALVVALAATIDHRHKGAVEIAAQEDAWYCAHGRRQRCTGFDEVSYEAHWEERELRYRISFFTLGAAAAVLGVASLRGRRAAAT
jgi:hypothetical protein